MFKTFQKIPPMIPQIYSNFLQNLIRFFQHFRNFTQNVHKILQILCEISINIITENDGRNEAHFRLVQF